MPENLQRDEHQRGVPASAAEQPAAGGGLGKAIRLILLVLVLGGAGVLGYFRLKSNQKEQDAVVAKTAQQANRAIPVSVMAVASKTMPIYITALGTVTAYNTVTIKSRVDGQLLSVNVREGQQVKQGQLLAVIDPAPYNAVVAQAVGQLAKDQATADYAKAEANRYTALYDAGVVSKDSQQVQISSAGQSAGLLEADRAAIQAAKVNVAYTRISSPINGVVGLRQVDAGNIVHAADTTGLLVVTELQPIAAIFTMPEDQLPQVLKLIRTGRKLTVEAYDRSNATKLATGSLLTLDNEIDTTTGTVKAKAVFDNKDGALFPNQFVNVRLILEERTGSLVVPASAVQSGTGGNFVYLLKAGNPPADGAGGGGKRGGGKKVAADAGAPAPAAAPAVAAGGDDEAAGAKKKPPFYVQTQNVVVDLTEGSQVILKSGVTAGDKVVVDGQEKLKPFSKVDPKPAKTQTADASGAGDAAPGAADTGSGSLDEPRGKHGSHGPDGAGAGAADGTHHHPRTGSPQ